METVEYSTMHINCPECGHPCEIVIVNSYNPHRDIEDVIDMAGYQDCNNCGYKFTNDDLDNEGE